jgi:hypothetical protein
MGELYSVNNIMQDGYDDCEDAVDKEDGVDRPQSLKN